MYHSLDFSTDLKYFKINRVRRKWVGMGSMLGYPKIKGRSSVRETRNPIQG